MLKQYFKTYQNKDHAAGKFRLILIFRAEFMADQNADGGKHKRSDADNGDRAPDIDIQKSKRDTDGKRVYTGCDCHNQQFLNIQNGFFTAVVLFFFEGIIDHFAAYDGKQDKCNPMIHSGYVGFKLRAEEPADQGHQRLKAAEEKSDERRLPKIELLHFQAAADRHGKRIHRKTDPNQKNF